MVYSLASGNAAATDVVSFDQTMPAIKLFWDDADESPGDLEAEFSDNSIVAYVATVSSGPQSPFTLTCNFDLTIKDPCTEPLETLTATTQNNLSTNYSGIPQVFTVTPFTTAPDLCAPTVVYTCTGVLGPDSLTTYDQLCAGWDPAPVSGGNLSLTASASDKADLPPGVYTFTITATDLSGATTDGSFTFTLVDKCQDLTCPTLATQEYTITAAEDNINEWSSLIDPDCVMTWSYAVLAADAADAITFTDSTPEFDVEYDLDLDLAGTDSPYYTDYTVTLTGAETDSTFEIDCDFTLRIKSPCPTLDAFTPTSQTGVTDNYTSATKYFTLTPFTVEPTLCADSVTYECTGVLGPDNITPYNYLCNSWDTDGVNGSLALTASASDKPTLPTGAYTFTITATDLSGATQTSTFTWTLNDLCSGLVCPVFEDPELYTIRSGSVEVNEFSGLISADCPMDFFYEVVDSAAENAILFDSITPKFTVFYAADLSLTSNVAPFYTDYTVTVIGKEAPPITTIDCDFTLRI